MNKKKKQISIWMTDEEVAMLEQIREHLKRSSFSDTLRVLVTETNKKILSRDTAIALSLVNVT